MIEVSQGIASSSTTSSSTSTSIASGTKTISIPTGALQKTVTLARAGGQQRQLITLPGGQTLVGSGQQTITLEGKPITVQVSTAGGQKTVTLVTSQGSGTIPANVAKLLSAGGGQSKVVLVPQSSVTTTAAASAQPETVTSTQSTPSATLSLSDGPATTDAALAALAAEAGLIDTPTAEEADASSAAPVVEPTATPVSIENEDALQLLAGMSAEMVDATSTLDPAATPVVSDAPMADASGLKSTNPTRTAIAMEVPPAAVKPTTENVPVDPIEAADGVDGIATNPV